jgi:hypothetical protein
MHISANIDDCAIIIDNFLEKNIFKKISNFNYQDVKIFGFYKSADKYLFLQDKVKTMEEVVDSDVLVEYSKGKFTTSYDKIFEDVIKVLIECPFLPFKENSTTTLAYYRYPKFSGINWHDDGIYSLNYSLYVMDEWHPDWGGETLIDTNRGLPLASIPKPNSLLAIKNGVKHRVCAVTGPVERRALQIRTVYHDE